jgi:hypothetical protein
MKNNKWILWGFVFLLALGLAMATACSKKEAEEPAETQEQAETQEKEEPEAEEQKVELPAAILEVIQANVPDAEIDTIEVGEEHGIKLYDIEFKDDRGEIEVAEDGTVIDVVTIVTMEELPEGAAQAIQKATEGMTIKRLEKSEIRAEIKLEEETGVIVKLDTPRFVYEAELEKDGKTGEITVDAEGNIVEELKWDEE